MTTRIIITSGKHKGQKARIVGIYTDGRVDAKIGHKYTILSKSTSFHYVD